MPKTFIWVLYNTYMNKHIFNLSQISCAKASITKLVILINIENIKTCGCKYFILPKLIFNFLIEAIGMGHVQFRLCIMLF